jgi:Ser/Thr protein kinase RdoA (MazF antagonist)
MNITSSIKQAAKESISRSIVDIIRETSGYDNQVFKAVTSGGEKLIVRIFHDDFWPEPGKLEWISRKLSENNIPTAKILYITRDNHYFKYGFMIQEYIDGDLVEKVAGQRITYEEYYSELGGIVRRIHHISYPAFGRIKAEDREFGSLEDYVKDDLLRFLHRLEELQIFSDSQKTVITDLTLSKLKKISDLSSVLCHNDLSPKNIILTPDDELVLIDWDNAIASCWLNDYSVMTYWMKFRHPDSSERQRYKDSFLKAYDPDCDINYINDVESAFHMIEAINLLWYYHEKNDNEQYEKTLGYINEILGSWKQ